MIKYLILNLFFMISMNSIAQNESQQDVLPFQDITEYPTSFTGENILARMVDGLGFRYFWATEGLREEDLAFRPVSEARSSEETIDHILGLSTIILNCIKNKPNLSSGEEKSPQSFIEKRRITLANLYETRQILISGEIKLEDLKIIFVRKDGSTELPAWNLVNGPVADALWHVGQIVSFRRSSGNPFNGRVNVMMGKLR